MAKKAQTKKPSTTPKPSPDQFKAVERLMQMRHCDQAAAKARELVRRFPAHGGARRALIESLDCAEGRHSAALAALEWSEARPNSLPAQETLLGYAKALGMLALADRAARRVRELGGTTPGFPLSQEILESMMQLPDGSRASLDNLERFDVGRLHLGAQDFEGAERRFAEIDLVSAANNRAIALFHLERVETALELFLDGWKRDPSNLLALGWAAAMRLFLGDETGAEGLCTPLAAATARRSDDLGSQLATLLLFGQEKAAWEAFERVRDADWLEVTGKWDGKDARLLHLAACAASRAGDRDAAKGLWERALAANGQLQLARANLDALRRDDPAAERPMALDVGQALPLTRLAKLRKPGAGEAEIDGLAASTAYLRAYYLNGDAHLRALIVIILKRRIGLGDQEAVECLKGFARLPIGAREERFDFLHFLRNEGFVAAGETLECHDGTKCTQIRLISTEIYRDPDESDLPDDLMDLLNRSIEAHRSGELEQAERHLRQVLERIPDHPTALGNFAALRMAQGRNEEAREILERNLAKNPDYLFARCNLASMLMRDGDLQRAKELLDGLAELERMHVDEYFAVYGALAQLQAAQGNRDAARKIVDDMETVAEEPHERERLMQIRRSVDPEGFAEELRNRMSKLLKRR